jgi:signal transduction histidine kinase
MSWLRVALPNRISAQITILIVLSVVAIHLVISTSFYLTRNEANRSPPHHGRDGLATVAQLIAAAPASERNRVAADAARAFPELNIARGVVFPQAAQDMRPDFEAEHLRRALGPSFAVARVEPGPGAEPHGARRTIVLRLPVGDSLQGSVGPAPFPPLFGGPFVMTALFLFVSVTLLGLWAARSLTKPLRNFAQAAESFRLDRDAPPIPERGPREILAAARALNEMHRRIRSLVEDRTRMLAALGHDLRTPLTRLRLRSEFVADDALRRQMLCDIDRMKVMTQTAVSYLRDGQVTEAMMPVDAASILQTICDEFADMGYRVEYAGPDHLTIEARPGELQRAVTNLVDNAVRYGQVVHVRLGRHDATVRIEVEDDGPGIALADRGAMLQPFIRGDEARNMDEPTGFGLGLAIAGAVVEAHRGTLTLDDAPTRGLVARIDLPAEPVAVAAG